MRRYHLTTFGCQMNAHDSERIKGALEELGLGEAVDPDEADVLVFNTCTIREKPDQRFAAHMGNAAKRKRERPDTVVAVGGCYAEAQRERIRCTSPHPKAFRRDVIEAMAECDAVCEHAHLPLQSGSTRLLKAMRRTYSRERYLKLAAALRDAIPDLALTTDIIVGFPGETEGDFVETLEVVEEVGYDGAFTFVYSPRVGTDAAAMPDQVPDAVKRDRIERLVELVQRHAAARNEERIGRVEEVLVEGPSRTDPTLVRGRTRRNTTVNFAGAAAAGDLVDVLIERTTSTTLAGSQVVVAVA